MVTAKKAVAKKVSPKKVWDEAVAQNPADPMALELATLVIHCTRCPLTFGATNEHDAISWFGRHCWSFHKGEYTEYSIVPITRTREQTTTLEAELNG